MSEKPLLLYSARSGVIVVPTPSHWWRKGAIALGVLAVLIGGADVTSRLSRGVLGDKAIFVAFAPAAAIADPSLLAHDLPAATAAPMVPTQLKIPSLNIDAPVESVGKKSDGSMGTPSKFGNVSWYKPGQKPGSSGNAVFAGHVNNALSTAGVFSHLSQIKLGAKIEVSDTSGRMLTFVVNKINEYAPSSAPLDEIFSSTGPSQIVLITCDGNWDSLAHGFDKRLVVVARLAAS